ncbi:MAG: hypothetical protein RSG23_08730 [Gordonibacter sp.]|uniref:hypothetical protein n=1 Tax=Gordonibacter sp. TaxID=1968902 RepID=UPI002FCC8138
MMLSLRDALLMSEDGFREPNYLVTREDKTMYETLGDCEEAALERLLDQEVVQFYACTEYVSDGMYGKKAVPVLVIEIA